MTTATMRKVRRSPSPNGNTHRDRQQLIAEKWAWTDAMMLGIWRMLRRAGVSGREIQEEIAGYLEALADTRPNPTD